MPKAPVNPNNISRIAEGTSIIGGKINSDCDIRFDGVYTGNISSKARVVIGENSNLKGNIICDNLDVWGTLVGDVVVKETFSLKEGSDFKGDVMSGSLEVEMGAIFSGHNRRISEEEFLEECKSDVFLSQDNDNEE